MPPSRPPSYPGLNLLRLVVASTGTMTLGTGTNRWVLEVEQARYWYRSLRYLLMPKVSQLEGLSLHLDRSEHRFVIESWKRDVDPLERLHKDGTRAAKSPFQPRGRKLLSKATLAPCWRAASRSARKAP